MTRAAEVVSFLVVVLVVLVVAAVLESGGPPHKEKHLPRQEARSSWRKRTYADKETQSNTAYLVLSRPANQPLFVVTSCQ